MANTEKSSTVIGITVSADDAAKLYSAYLGLPTQRQAIVDEAVRDGVSIHQATFDEIFIPKLEHYVQKGEEARKQIAEKTVAMLSCLSPIEKQELLAKLGQAQ
jgi:hypothetical protein